MRPAPAPHRAAVRVRYGETDQMGVVYHANYILYFEIGRSEAMRAAGVSYREMEERGMALAVVEVALRYRRPARYDDELIVETRVTDASAVQVRFDYRVLRHDGAGETLLAEGHTVLACVDRSGKPMRIASPYGERIREMVAR